MSERKTCFVIMPFGSKLDADGKETNFDLIYSGIIQPAVEEAGLRPLRCDEIERPGTIHDDMFEQIATAAAAVVDITNLNANVFYELGARHALRSAVTVLIRKKGGSVPFNIQDQRVIEYSTDRAGIVGSKAQVVRFLQAGLEGGEADSPFQPVLERLKAASAAADESRRIDEQHAFSFSVKARPGRSIEVRTGDLRKWKGVDVWVNSENTNMQMARFHDRSLSAVIRYYGAEKDENDEVTKDTIAMELAEQMAGRESVLPGTVFATTSGALAETHGVRKIFHVASVVGVPGAGYQALSEIVDTFVNRCLRRMDREGDLASIAFPMIGTGAGGSDVHQVAEKLVNTAAAYLAETDDTRVETVIFMAWNGRDLTACTAALAKCDLVEPASRVSQ